MANTKISIEVWFALAGLVAGIAFAIYRAATPPTPVGLSPYPASVPHEPVRDGEGSAAQGTPVTLGSPVTINQAVAPQVQSPDADPLLPPTSPQLDAVLALKYYLLSDANQDALSLLENMPKDSRDLVVRSALYAVWDRGEEGHGDWFMGATVDPYTSRLSAIKMGSDPVRSIDTADAPITQKRIDAEVELAHQRIELVRQLLQMVEPKTQSYWMPYLVVKLRRMHAIGADDRQTLINQLDEEGNQAIATSLKEWKNETDESQRWLWVSRTFNVSLPIVLSALGFIFAKISQSSLAAIDRWMATRWFKVEPPKS